MPILPYRSTDDASAVPPLPALLLALLVPWLDPLLTWLSARLYHTLLARCTTHPLVQLAQTYDPVAVIHACATFHHLTGPGRPPTYPVAVLVRAEIVRVWAGSCSDPALERLLVTDLVARWYVGLPLFAPTPDHATLNRFHAWLSRHQPQALFADVLTFLDRVDPEDPVTTPQIADTFALASPAVPTSASVVLLRLCGQLVDAWFQHAPATAQRAVPPLDLGPLHRPGAAHTHAQHQAQLVQAVTLATWLQTALTPCLPTLDRVLRTRIEAQLAQLAKVIADETMTNLDGLVQERPAGQKGSYRLASVVDVEATFRKHASDPAVFGYNAAIATTTTRIRAATVLPGSTPDSEAPVALVEQQQRAGLPLPAVLVMDQAAGWGKTRAQVAVVSHGATQVVALVPQPGGMDLTRFTPADFHISANEQACTCPQGVVSSQRYQSGAGDGVHFRFTATQCQGCPLWDQCRAPTSKPTSHRTVYLSPYQQHLRAGAAFNMTAAGQALLRQRWRVEPTIAWLVRYDGCRRARRVGRAAAQCQLSQACAGRNLWRWLGRRGQRRMLAQP